MLYTSYKHKLTETQIWFSTKRHVSLMKTVAFVYLRNWVKNTCSDVKYFWLTFLI